MLQLTEFYLNMYVTFDAAVAQWQFACKRDACGFDTIRGNDYVTQQTMSQNWTESEERSDTGGKN